MVVKVLAWDYSGSTSHIAHYFKIGKTYFRQFRARSEDDVQDGCKDIYLLWDTSCEKITSEKLDEICAKREGRGGTDPSTIIEWMKKNISKEEQIELWLITDGQIGSSELRKCATLNVDMNYSQIKFIIISTFHINMSVGASFFRGSQIEIFTNDQILKSINTSKPYEYDKITLANFESKWDDLSDFIQAKFMGSDIESLEEVDKLNLLRKRLLDEILRNSSQTESKKATFSSKNKSDILNDLKLCQFYKTLVNSSATDLRSKIDASISTLVNYIHNKNKSYTFDSLKVEYKQNKMQEFEEETEPEVDGLADVEDCTFYDAITLDIEQGTPVLLLNTTDLIEKYWLNGNYSKFRGIADCPLTAKIGESIGHVYLLETFKSLMENQDSHVISNPMTNQHVYGGLIFSPGADNWNDFVLSKSFFRGKKIKTCFPLWYYVIWKHAENVKWIDATVKEQLKSYAFRRLENAKVRLAFSSLPLDPKEIVSVPVACFYCTEGSSILFGEHPELFLQEKLRMYGFVADQMLEILNHFGYLDINSEFVLERAKTFQYLNILKQIPRETDKRYFLLQNIFEKRGQFLVREMKNQGEVKYLNLLKYHHKNSMIPFKYDSTPVDLNKFVLVSYDRENKYEIKLSLDTFRPYFVVDTDDKREPISYYTQLLASSIKCSITAKGEIVKEPVTKINQNRVMSCNKNFIDLTNILGKYPTIEEFLSYIAKAKQFHENKLIRLFPLDIENDIQETFEQYAQIIADVPVEDFIKKTQASVHVETRIQMEQILKNNHDLEKFINEAKKLLAI